MSEEEVQISVSKDEALVLFELLSRFSETGKLAIEHQSEERTLWNLNSQLEKIQIEPFKSNYADLLQQAQERLKDKENNAK